MVKKVSQTSSKISKNEKKPINNVINILRPKVYITRSTSFKRLVQELTSNGSTPPATELQQTIKEVPVVDIQDHQVLESGTKDFIDASIDLFEFCDQVSYTNELMQAYNEVCLDDNIISINQQADLSVYQEIESWLLDVEPYPSYNGNADIEHMVNIFD